jgi:Tripartite tricarboxylate transporter family receptor
LRQLRPILLIIGLAFSAADPAAAQAQSFPNHPIRIIIGPSPDIFSRIIAEHLQETCGQPVAVEPRPGAGGKLAVTAVSTAVPDGHTLLFATPTYTLNTAMKVATYDLLQEFGPVSMIGVISYVLIIHSSVPAMSVAELVAYAKQSPRRAQLCVGGHRHRPAPRVRISQQDRRHQYSPRTLSRREFGDDGDRRQRHADVLRRLDQCQVADRFKHAARARSEHGATLAASPRPADNDRVGLSDLRHAGLGGCSHLRAHPPTLSKSSIGRCGGRLSGLICRSGSSPSGWNRHRRRPPPNSGHSSRTTLPAGRNSSMQSELTSSKEKHLNNRLFGENPDNQNKSIDR